MPNTGTTTARGYGSAHRRLRDQWKPVVDAGEAFCSAVTCVDPDGTGRWIMPGRPWDLGHLPDRSGWTSPEHSSCNRREGAVRRNAKRASAEAPATPSNEDWWS